MPDATPRVDETMTEQARATIRAAGVTITGYVREQGYANGWGGDRCGCPDDRCIGYHHYDETDCGCLPVLLGQYVSSLRAEVTPDA